MSSGRMGRCGPSVTIRMPSWMIVWSSFLPGSGPRSRSMSTAGIGSRAIAPMRVLRMIERSTMPLSSTPPARMTAKSSRSGCGERRRVPLVDDLLVDHELLGPVDGTQADEQDREAQRQPEEEVGRRRLQQSRDDDDRLVGLREGDERDHEGEGRERGQAEEQGHLALGALRRPGVGVSEPRTVRGETRREARELRAVPCAPWGSAPWPSGSVGTTAWSSCVLMKPSPRSTRPLHPAG